MSSTGASPSAMNSTHEGLTMHSASKEQTRAMLCLQLCDTTSVSDSEIDDDLPGAYQYSRAITPTSQLSPQLFDEDIVMPQQSCPFLYNDYTSSASSTTPSSPYAIWGDDGIPSDYVVVITPSPLHTQDSEECDEEVYETIVIISDEEDDENVIIISDEED